MITSMIIVFFLIVSHLLPISLNPDLTRTRGSSSLLTGLHGVGQQYANCLLGEDNHQQSYSVAGPDSYNINLPGRCTHGNSGIAIMGVTNYLFFFGF